MLRTLIVYYSLTGNTEKVAREMATHLNADLEPIEEVSPRRGALGHLRTLFEMIFRSTPRIKPSRKAIEDYDLVILGAPVWASSAASPMRAFIARECGRIDDFAVFCTEEGVGGEKANRQISAPCAKEAAARMIVLEKDVKSGAFKSQVAEFVEKITARPTAAT